MCVTEPALFAAVCKQSRAERLSAVRAVGCCKRSVVWVINPVKSTSSAAPGLKESHAQICLLCKIKIRMRLTSG